MTFFGLVSLHHRVQQVHASFRHANLAHSDDNNGYIRHFCWSHKLHHRSVFPIESLRVHCDGHLLYFPPFARSLLTPLNCFPFFPSSSRVIRHVYASQAITRWPFVSTRQRLSGSYTQTCHRLGEVRGKSGNCLPLLSVQRDGNTTEKETKTRVILTRAAGTMATTAEKSWTWSSKSGSLRLDASSCFWKTR